MAASTSVPLSRASQASFVSYYNTTQDMQNTFRSNLRARLETIDRAYQREVDKLTEQTRAKAANKAGDTDKFQNITVPVVMPQVEAAVTYQTSVFLTGNPLFGVVADPTFIDEAMQMETVIDENSVRGGWAMELMKFFRDGFKYNYAPVEVDWKQVVTAAIDTDLETSLKEGKPTEVIWKGNRVKRLDPYNTFVDSRVLPTDVYKTGEFAGYTEYLPRMALKALVAELPDKIVANLTAAFASGIGAGPTRTATSKSYYVPDINPEVSSEGVTYSGLNWMSWAGIAEAKKALEYKDSYEVTTFYCRILPSEFGLKIPKGNTPQVFKLIIVNHEHIIYCERQTNAHALIPILIGQPLDDGLGYQTKSLATNGQPFQELASSYMNSIIASRRRAISDRTLYDPSRVSQAHINSANPSAKIPVRPSAYGKNIAEAVHQFPYREDQAGTSMQQIQQLLGLANMLNGQNQASQGQFVKGNKTLHEFESVMDNANGRDQLVAILLESQVFTPMKEILKINILQYQGGTTLYNRDKNVAIEIDPIKLRKAALQFKISDGLVPSDKLINAETFSVALQVMGSTPQIASGYNVPQLFSYFMKTQGAKISEFEKSPEQLAFEQALQSWENLSALGIENGIEPEKLPPQPKPEEFGYIPANNKPAPEEGQQKPPQESIVPAT